MESVLLKVSSFIAAIVLGYVLKRIGFFKADDFRLISGLVLKVTLPSAVISNFSRIDIDISLFAIILIGIGINVMMMLAGWLSVRGRGREAEAFAIINYTGFNVGCFAMPFLSSFTGPLGVVATCLFDTANSLMCIGATNSVAGLVLGQNTGGGIRVFLKRMFASIPLDVYLFMAAISLAGLKLPGEVLVFTDFAGAANPFLAMLMLGIGFEFALEPGQGKAILRTLAIRYLIGAVLGWIFWNYLPFDEEVRKVVTITAFAPIAAFCTIVTAICFREPKRVALSCTLNSASIAVSVAIMAFLVIWL